MTGKATEKPDYKPPHVRSEGLRKVSDMLLRLQLPGGYTLGYVLRMLVIVILSLCALEVILQRFELGNVHVYNLSTRAGDFFKVHEPCYPPFQQDRFAFLRTALHGFKAAAKEVGLTYWLEFGTLLGAKRAASFIPWDHDMDLGVFKHELLPREEQFVKALRRRNLDLVRQETGCKFRVSKYNSTTGERSLVYRFDMFMFTTTDAQQTSAFYRQFPTVARATLLRTRKGEEIKTGEEIMTRCGLPDWYRYLTPRKYLYDLHEIKFEGTMAMAPRDAMEMIRLYRYPYSYWMRLPYKINCYFEPQYIWVTYFFLVAVLSMVMCCACCRRRCRTRLKWPVCVCWLWR
eukprot:scpid70701/ scgid31198/ 